MANKEPRVECRTPTPGKKATRIEKWKYDAVRAAILKAVPKNKTGVEFAQLPAAVAAELPGDIRRRVGSIMWYTTVVKLDMEVRGEIERIADSKPQRLRRPARKASE